MELTPVEARVLGSLIEKRATTPDHYPLTTNALLNACNQKTNREPVMDLSERDIAEAMMELRANKLCRTVASGRVEKHKHVLDETLELSDTELAVLAIMLLRGPQTPGELRQRTDRYVTFDSLADIEDVLADLSSGERPLVVDLGRGPGQSQNRFMHLLAGEVDPGAQPTAVYGTVDRSTGPSRTDRLSALEQRVVDLESRLAKLEAELGLG